MSCIVRQEYPEASSYELHAERKYRAILQPHLGLSQPHGVWLFPIDLNPAYEEALARVRLLNNGL